MTREDIIRMARESGFEFKDRAEPKLERFAALVVAKEREACAKECEEFGQTLEVDVGPNFAEAIRARGMRND